MASAPVASPTAGGDAAWADDADGDAIRVCVRIRPLSASEIGQQEGSERIEWQFNDTTIVEDSDIARKAYHFDAVFGPATSNAQVYERCARRVVLKALQGYNGTVFAYGQTGSGKTYSMLGTAGDPGIVPRAVRDIFDHIASETTRSRGTTEYLVRVSYLEVYNEEINDLLQPLSKGRGKNLKILREDPARGAVIEGLLEEIVVSSSQVMDVVARGESNRHYGSTNINAGSSRSHTVFRMTLESRTAPDADGGGGDASAAGASPTRDDSGGGGGDSDADSTAAAAGAGSGGKWQSVGGRRPGDSGSIIKVAYLNLVDLAGSERQEAAGTSGERLREGAAINKSLSALALVISRLAEAAKRETDRASKLTAAAQASLGMGGISEEAGEVAAAAAAAGSGDDTGVSPRGSEEMVGFGGSIGAGGTGSGGETESTSVGGDSEAATSTGTAGGVPAAAAAAPAAVTSPLKRAATGVGSLTRAASARVLSPTGSDATSPPGSVAGARAGSPLAPTGIAALRSPSGGIAGTARAMPGSPMRAASGESAASGSTAGGRPSITGVQALKRAATMARSSKVWGAAGGGGGGLATSASSSNLTAMAATASGSPPGPGGSTGSTLNLPPIPPSSRTGSGTGDAFGSGSVTPSGEFIPYRNSKLTRLLRQSLGGNTYTAILCAMSPAIATKEESISTLKFGTQCKAVRNRAVMNRLVDDKTLLRQYRQRITQLKAQIDTFASANAAAQAQAAAALQLLLSQDDGGALDGDAAAALAALTAPAAPPGAAPQSPLTTVAGRLAGASTADIHASLLATVRRLARAKSFRSSASASGAASDDEDGDNSDVEVITGALDGLSPRRSGRGNGTRGGNGLGRARFATSPDLVLPALPPAGSTIGGGDSEDAAIGLAGEGRRGAGAAAALSPSNAKLSAALLEVEETRARAVQLERTVARLQGLIIGGTPGPTTTGTRRFLDAAADSPVPALLAPPGPGGRRRAAGEGGASAGGADASLISPAASRRPRRRASVCVTNDEGIHSLTAVYFGSPTPAGTSAGASPTLQVGADGAADATAAGALDSAFGSDLRSPLGGTFGPRSGDGLPPLAAARARVTGEPVSFAESVTRRHARADSLLSGDGAFEVGGGGAGDGGHITRARLDSMGSVFSSVSGGGAGRRYAGSDFGRTGLSPTTAGGGSGEQGHEASPPPPPPAGSFRSGSRPLSDGSGTWEVDSESGDGDGDESGSPSPRRAAGTGLPTSAGAILAIPSHRHARLRQVVPLPPGYIAPPPTPPALRPHLAANILASAFDEGDGIVTSPTGQPLSDVDRMLAIVRKARQRQGDAMAAAAAASPAQVAEAVGRERARMEADVNELLASIANALGGHADLREVLASVARTLRGNATHHAGDLSTLAGEREAARRQVETLAGQIEVLRRHNAMLQAQVTEATERAESTQRRLTAVEAEATAREAKLAISARAAEQAAAAAAAARIAALEARAAEAEAATNEMRQRFGFELAQARDRAAAAALDAEEAAKRRIAAEASAHATRLADAEAAVALVQAELSSSHAAADAFRAEATALRRERDELASRLDGENSFAVTTRRTLDEREREVALREGSVATMLAATETLQEELDKRLVELTRREAAVVVADAAIAARSEQQDERDIRHERHVAEWESAQQIQAAFRQHLVSQAKAAMARTAGLDAELAARDAALTARERALGDHAAALNERATALDAREAALSSRESEFVASMAKLQAMMAALADHEDALAAQETEFRQRQLDAAASPASSVGPPHMLASPPPPRRSPAPSSGSGAASAGGSLDGAGVRLQGSLMTSPVTPNGGAASAGDGGSSIAHGGSATAVESRASTPLPYPTAASLLAEPPPTSVDDAVRLVASPLGGVAPVAGGGDSVGDPFGPVAISRASSSTSTSAASSPSSRGAAARDDGSRPAAASASPQSSDSRLWSPSSSPGSASPSHADDVASGVGSAVDGSPSQRLPESSQRFIAVVREQLAREMARERDEVLAQAARHREQLEAALAAREAAIASMRDAVTADATALEARAQKLAALEVALAEARAAIASREASATTREAALATAESRIGDVEAGQRSAAAATSLLAALAVERDALAAERALLEADRADHASQRAALDADAAAVASERVALEREKGSLTLLAQGMEQVARLQQRHAQHLVATQAQVASDGAAAAGHDSSSMRGRISGSGATMPSLPLPTLPGAQLAAPLRLRTSSAEGGSGEDSGAGPAATQSPLRRLASYRLAADGATAAGGTVTLLAESDAPADREETPVVDDGAVGAVVDAGASVEAAEDGVAVVRLDATALMSPPTSPPAATDAPPQSDPDDSPSTAAVMAMATKLRSLRAELAEADAALSTELRSAALLRMEADTLRAALATVTGHAQAFASVLDALRDAGLWRHDVAPAQLAALLAGDGDAAAPSVAAALARVMERLHASETAAMAAAHAASPADSLLLGVGALSEEAEPNLHHPHAGRGSPAVHAATPGRRSTSRSSGNGRAAAAAGSSPFRTPSAASTASGSGVPATGRHTPRLPAPVTTLPPHPPAYTFASTSAAPSYTFGAVTPATGTARSGAAAAPRSTVRLSSAGSTSSRSPAVTSHAAAAELTSPSAGSGASPPRAAPAILSSVPTPGRGAGSAGGMSGLDGAATSPGMSLLRAVSRGGGYRGPAIPPPILATAVLHSPGAGHTAGSARSAASLSSGAGAVAQHATGQGTRILKPPPLPPSIPLSLVLASSHGLAAPHAATAVAGSE